MRIKSLLCFLLIAIFGAVNVGCFAKVSNVESSEQKQYKESWPKQSFKKIPFTDFNTKNHKINVEFLAEKLQSRLHIDNGGYVILPEAQLPVKVLEISDNQFLVISKTLFSGKLTMFEVKVGESIKQTQFPEFLTSSLFKQAIVYNTGDSKEILMVLYDVKKLQNYLYRWIIDKNGYFTFDQSFIDKDMKFNGRYEVDANIFAGEVKDKLYFVAEGVCFTYENKGFPSLKRSELQGKLSVVEFAINDNSAVALFQDEEAASLVKPDISIDSLQIFKAFDLQTLTPILTKETKGLPYNLRFEDSKWTLSQVKTTRDLSMVLTQDLNTRQPSGIYDLGGNNMEGRVAWSQVYYLNGFIDTITNWKHDNVNFSFLDTLREDMKLRLDIEMYLMDRLVDQGNIGLVSSRYSVARKPVTHAVQTGRVLRLFKRYANEVENPLQLINLERLKSMTENLDGHIEVLAEADADKFGMKKGQYYLKWPKGSAFWCDGVAIPYNHQDDWAGGVAYGASAKEQDSLYLRAAKDIVTILLTNEGFYNNPPKEFQWQYNWGEAWQGWKDSDNISVNTPQYPGDHSMAHISYRVIDTMAVLSVGHIYPEILPAKFLEYLNDAVQHNGVYPFIAEEMLRYNVYPEVPSAFAATYYRVKGPWELQNSVWSILSLDHHINRWERYNPINFLKRYFKGAK